MAGETDLTTMLATLTVTRRPGTYAFVLIGGAAQDAEGVTVGDGVEALITEAEGLIAVVTIDRAEREGWTFDFEAAWLTLDVHSALEAVGLTAAFSVALAEVGIACNVLAGLHHDHLLVPTERADDAISCLVRLRTTGVKSYFPTSPAGSPARASMREVGK